MIAKRTEHNGERSRTPRFARIDKVNHNPCVGGSNPSSATTVCGLFIAGALYGMAFQPPNSHHILGRFSFRTVPFAEPDAFRIDLYVFGEKHRIHAVEASASRGRWPC